MSRRQCDVLSDLATLEPKQVCPPDFLLGTRPILAHRADEYGREVTVQGDHLDLLLDTGAGYDVPHELLARRTAAHGPRLLDKRVRTNVCLLYTSDAADDLLCVDLGGRR